MPDSEPIGSLPETYSFGWRALRSRLDRMSDAERLMLGDCAGRGGSRAARVTGILRLAFDLPDDAFDPDRLSLVDRTAALFAVAHQMGRWPARFACQCLDCSAANELRVRPAEFDYEPARDYRVAVGSARFMQPNGYHEALVEQVRQLPVQALAITNEPADSASVATDAESVFAALDAVAARFKTALPYQCTQCGAENRFWFDPLNWIVRHAQALLHEVHQLARAYGWTESEILALPRVRRQAYIGLTEGPP